ncbi:hypothetical protein SOVF_161850 [Spinacia oleracea]|nr:hypothetical protein SOVF_161850 [Spinacia oleracea]
MTCDWGIRISEKSKPMLIKLLTKIFQGLTLSLLTFLVTVHWLMSPTRLNCSVTGKITLSVTFYATTGGISAAFISVFWSFGYLRL